MVQCVAFMALSFRIQLLPRESVAVCCSVLQCVAVCCSIVQCIALCGLFPMELHLGMKGFGAACCSDCIVLQCVAVCCSVLQIVAFSVELYLDNDEMPISCDMTHSYVCHN